MGGRRKRPHGTVKLARQCLGKVCLPHLTTQVPKLLSEDGGVFCRERSRACAKGARLARNHRVASWVQRCQPLRVSEQLDTTWAVGMRSPQHKRMWTHAPCVYPRAWPPMWGRRRLPSCLSGTLLWGCWGLHLSTCSPPSNKANLKHLTRWPQRRHHSLQLA